jgi:hypothetical protein
MENILDRIKQIASNERVTITAFEQKIGASKGVLSRAIANGTDIQYKWVQKIVENYPQYSADWLIKGNGTMFKTLDSDRKKIPLYDVESIGGINERSANMEGVTQPSEWIDAGDWFMNATAAIHHYGDSMVEYPSGCILALREVLDRQLIVWGKNYVIETDEYRITKRLQRCDTDDNYIMAYSTNPETYPDGKLIHEPVPIPRESIRRLAIVLGYVVKEQSSGIVYNVRNKK